MLGVNKRNRVEQTRTRKVAMDMKHAAVKMLDLEDIPSSVSVLILESIL